MVLRIRIELMTFRASTERSTNMSYLSIIGGTSQSRTENTMGLSHLPLPIGLMSLMVGASEEIRTLNPSLARDFKSLVYTNSTTLAYGTQGWT